MDQKRISTSDIVVGEPLKWDAFDADGKLLLCKGYVVESERQLVGLIEQGMYTGGLNAQNAHQRSELENKIEVPSVVRMLNLANKRLERLLYHLPVETDAKTSILDLVKVITEAVDLNRDIALGCISLNQQVGNYSIRHSIDTAIISLLIMRSMNKTADEVSTVMAAALTMNLGMLRHQDLWINKDEALPELELAIIKKHPEESVTMLRQAGIDDSAWLDCVLMHHENEDGSGYPAHFIKTLGAYPPGTFVWLLNNEIAVVTETGETPATPIVQALVGTSGAPLSMPLKRNTAKQVHKIKELIPIDQKMLRFSLHQLWGDQANL